MGLRKQRINIFNPYSLELNSRAGTSGLVWAQSCAGLAVKITYTKFRSLKRLPSVVIETKVKGGPVAAGMTKELVDDVATLVGVLLFVMIFIVSIAPG